MNNLYIESPYENHRRSCELSILSLQLPENFWQSFFLGFSTLQHPIYAYRLGIGQKKLLITGGVHGREAINSFVILSLMLHYLSHLSCYLDWFTSHTLYLLPMLNPDGYLKALEIPDWKNNGNNVDLNRNFPCRFWKTKWEGDSPSSEPETKLLINFFHKIQPDWYLDIHSRGQGIYYYRNSMPASYNQTQLQIAKKLKFYTGYELYHPDMEINQNDSGGNTVQYFAEVYQKPAFTLETVPDHANFPIPDFYKESIFHELVNILFIF